MKIEGADVYELANLAYETLKPHRDPKRALDGFRKSLSKRPDLLTALLMDYLSARAADMLGVSHFPHESQMSADHPETNGRMCQSAGESQPFHDRPAEPRKRDIGGNGGASLGIHASQVWYDRPAVPAPSRITAKGVAAVAEGIWKQKIGIADVDLGSATRHHFVTIKRKTMALGSVADAFLTEVDWKDDDTPLCKVASADQVRAIWDRRYKVLDVMGLTNGAP